MTQIRALASFLFGRAGAVARNHVAFAYAIKCRRAVGLSTAMSGSNRTCA